ncbi:hypothetical protein SAE02_76320 [Skermanella aerolata]|uniref:Uncharacterized protein n=1 Tax=Skermanella aerolata TaxID=393310 RepID=A0A512E424_9PROT|nr:hypothetical protein SAE02_76320 [Skermanella aerolata]
MAALLKVLPTPCLALPPRPFRQVCRDVRGWTRITDAPCDTCRLLVLCRPDQPKDDATCRDANHPAADLSRSPFSAETGNAPWSGGGDSKDQVRWEKAIE